MFPRWFRTRQRVLPTLVQSAAKWRWSSPSNPLRNRATLLLPKCVQRHGVAAQVCVAPHFPVGYHLWVNYSAIFLQDMWGRPVLLFRNDWNVTQLLGDNPEIGELAPYSLPPVEQG
jgi:hypothetical protein